MPCHLIFILLSSTDIWRLCHPWKTLIKFEIYLIIYYSVFNKKMNGNESNVWTWKESKQRIQTALNKTFAKNVMGNVMIKGFQVTNYNFMLHFHQITDCPYASNERWVDPHIEISLTWWVQKSFFAKRVIFRKKNVKTFGEILHKVILAAF